jgi:hypothetical protein
MGVSWPDVALVPVAGFRAAELAEMGLAVFHPGRSMEKSRVTLEAKTCELIHDDCLLRRRCDNMKQEGDC